ncbi:3-oxoacyl-ACP synthase III family protein [Roseisolibacter agri]|uniref:3-oxoacyl-ACP synthase III family protein n=1 Tax=Roseisolibacter agri TaxID=2014610 RepID=UPI0024E121F5|nr:ketoacyl-ACP synthase III [Roseisolibacter agri]
MAHRVRLLGVAASLPPQVRTSSEVEALIARASPGYRVRPGAVEALSGVRTRRVAADDVQCSDLAVDAARRALDVAERRPADVDLLVFAAASQDLMEPATAHIVQAKLGTRAQVFDVKNACNSFLAGVQVAESLIASGAARTALVATGEPCSRAVAWRVRDGAEFRRSFPGYTMGDAGAAAVLGRAPDGRGIFHHHTEALSDHWELATIRGGGSMHPRDHAHDFLHADGVRLKDAFIAHGPAVLARSMERAGVTFADFRRILVHQATLPYLHEMLAATGMPADLVELTVVDHGNMAAASLPVAYAQATARGALAPGDRVLWVGLASGISVHVMMSDV